MWQDWRMAKPKNCPQCNREFRGKGWEGIDAHWRANHNQIMRYEDARLLILTGRYKRKDPSMKYPDRRAVRPI
jgi:hypothetical protein